jgi:hypothetical protein
MHVKGEKFVRYFGKESLVWMGRQRRWREKRSDQRTETCVVFLGLE